MQTFKDSKGREWSLNITYDAVQKVLDLHGIDIFAMVEKIDFSPLKNIHNLCKIVFTLCFTQILDEFDVEKYDAENEAFYELFPDHKNELKSQKAMRWFCSFLTGSVILEMTDALMQEIINFTSNPTRREAILSIIEKETEIETLSIQNGTEQALQKIANFQTKLPQIISEKLQEMEDQNPSLQERPGT